MFDTYKLKVWMNWPSVRAHICTAAVAVSFNSSWRVPRDAFRYGGVAYGLLFTVAMVTVALPTALFQLAVGQLSQQDSVGMWRAVPFFRGVGYLRLLISFLASIYTVTYVAITATNFFYSLNNSIPLWECSVSFIAQDNNDTNENVYNMSTCVNGSVLAPVHEQPEYYVAMALITVLLWVLFPIVYVVGALFPSLYCLYNPVKSMKKLFYGTTPLVAVLAITILSGTGNKNDILLIYDDADWTYLTQSKIWHAAVIQALWSTQIAGGYLVSVGDTIYSSTDVIWTTLIFVGLNLLAGWLGIIFWFKIGGSGERDTSVLAVLAQTYRVAEENSLDAVWPPLIFAFLLVSGIITVLTLLYPVYDRLKRVGRHRWRYLALGSSAAGAAAGLAALAAGLPALSLFDDTVLPCLVSVTTVLEICPFIFIYGWRVLIEDIEFLVGHELSKYWMWGWCAVVVVLAPFTLWWVTAHILAQQWAEPPWAGSGLAAAAGAALALLASFAALAVARQVQYDVIAKLKSSFKPSRHWGPRDPITHYYWLARREDTERNQPRTRYHRRQLGQFSGNTSFLNIDNNRISNTETMTENKRRSNSDDWLYTYRKQNLAEIYQECKFGTRKRSKSLDWDVISNLKHRSIGYSKYLNVERSDAVPADIVVSMPENNNNIVNHL